MPPLPLPPPPPLPVVRKRPVTVVVCPSDKVSPDRSCGSAQLSRRLFPNLHRHRHSRTLLVRQYIVCGKLALGHIFREIYAAGIAEARSGIERLPRNGIQMGDEEVCVDDVHLVFARTGTAVGLLLVQELLHIGCNDAVVRQRTFDGYLYAVPPLLARKVCGGVAEKASRRR